MIIKKFGAEWCAPCKMLEPILEDLKQSNPNLTVEAIDVDNEPEIAAQSHVRGLPTLIFLKEGQEVNRLVGATTKRAIEEVLNV